MALVDRDGDGNVLSSCFMATDDEVAVRMPSSIGMEPARPISSGRIRHLPRGMAEGVSGKSYGPLLRQRPFSWTNRMLGWERTGFHFQPLKNWMNGMAIHLLC